MLRPERMSRVSVTGSGAVMEEVIETVHDLNLLHFTEYGGDWEGFEPGDPIEGADEAANKLVTVRALENTLGIEAEDAGPTQLVTEESLEEELEEVRREVNEIDDRRAEVRDELRDVRERIGTFEPFARLGIDLDLLWGYGSLAVAVGEGDAGGIERQLGAADEVEAAEVFAEDNAVAAFVYPAGDRDPAELEVSDLLVGVEFTPVEVPDAEGDPEEYLSKLRSRESQLESRLETVENEMEDLKLDVAGFLLAAEERLSIEVQKREAPLTFATSENAFVAEGWIPTARYDEFVGALESAVGDRVEVEELERADYDDEGHATAREEVGDYEEPGVPGEPAAANGGEQEARADGGAVTMGPDEPPVVQDNPGPVKPFEALVEVINRPKYSEFDPTVVLFLTFPFFFGFMIGDLGYGILYLALGYWLWTAFDSDVIRSLGGVGMWAGGFTAVFGVLYGEFFGLHQLGEIVWGGSPPLHKGLGPAHAEWALGWLVVSLLAGMAHLAVGWIFDFVENLRHGLVDAVTESGSWLLMMFGLWAWIFAGAFGNAPSLVYGPDSVFAGHPFPLGFAGFAEPVGLAGLAAFGVGLFLLLYAEPIEGVEFLNVLVNVLSYTRMPAVLLAKAGMAFVANLLFFGVYVTREGESLAWHFGIGGMPAVGETVHGHEVVDVMFGGLLHSGVAGVLVGVVVLVVGHLLVLALGITSAGLQAIRLEYVEFFSKFYEGGGKSYDPFGYDRQFTAEDG